MKTVYTVRGSNDGIIGVYTTPKRAWEKAIAYGEGEVKQSYKEFRAFCKENAEYTNAIFTVAKINDDYNVVEITLWALNN